MAPATVPADNKATMAGKIGFRIGAVPKISLAPGKCRQNPATCGRRQRAVKTLRRLAHHFTLPQCDSRGGLPSALDRLPDSDGCAGSME